jgi:ethylmalonyl-CoA/methylmalonyl-CoA decarboxylase
MLDLSSAKTDALNKTFANEMSLVMSSTLARISALPLISVAMIDGYAIGGGAELTTAADIRMMTRSAKVRFVHSKMGVVSGWGGASRVLSKLKLSSKQTLDLLVASKVLSAENAISAGYADVVLDSDSDDAVEQGLVDVLSPYIFDKDIVVSDTPTRRSVSSIRGFKHILVAQRMPQWNSILPIERDIFCQLWGGSDNLAALERAAKTMHSKSSKK